MEAITGQAGTAGKGWEVGVTPVAFFVLLTHNELVPFLDDFLGFKFDREMSAFEWNLVLCDQTEAGDSDNRGNEELLHLCGV